MGTLLNMPKYEDTYYFLGNESCILGKGRQWTQFSFKLCEHHKING